MPIGAAETTMCRLLYTSRPNLAVPPESTLHYVEALARTAAERNRRVSLTGSLLYFEDRFIQVLEGPRTNAETVFEAICCDFRHSDVALIDFISANERLFPDWEMALIGTGRGEAKASVEELDEIRLLVGINAREAERQIRGLLDSCFA